MLAGHWLVFSRVRTFPDNLMKTQNFPLFRKQPNDLPISSRFSNRSMPVRCWHLIENIIPNLNENMDYLMIYDSGHFQTKIWIPDIISLLESLPQGCFIAPGCSNIYFIFSKSHETKYIPDACCIQQGGGLQQLRDRIINLERIKRNFKFFHILFCLTEK